MSQIEIGRLLRAGTSGFVIGCRVSQLEAPAFGAMVRVSLPIKWQLTQTTGHSEKEETACHLKREQTTDRLDQL